MWVEMNVSAAAVGRVACSRGAAFAFIERSSRAIQRVDAAGSSEGEQAAAAFAFCCPQQLVCMQKERPPTRKIASVSLDRPPPPPASTPTTKWGVTDRPPLSGESRALPPVREDAGGGGGVGVGVGLSRAPLLSSGRASSNWLRVGSAAIRKTSSPPTLATDVVTLASTPTSIDAAPIGGGSGGGGGGERSVTIADDVRAPLASPPTPLTARSHSSSRRPSGWENLMANAAVVSGRLGCKPNLAAVRIKSNAACIFFAAIDVGILRNTTAPISVSAEINQMKIKRVCSLEWEFLATVLDRIFLVAFLWVVFVATAGMMLTGHMAQLHYDTFNDDSNNEL